MLRRILILGLSALAIAWTGSARAEFFFDFNNQSDAGLTRYNPLAAFGQGGTYSFPLLSPGNYGYQLIQAGVPANNNAGPARMGSSVTGQTFADLTESVDVVDVDPTLGFVFGLGARVNNIGLGTTSGYALVYSTPSGEGTPTGEFSFDRVTDEMATDIGLASHLTLQAGHSYRFALTAVGSSLTGQLFDLANPALPLATASATDTTYATGSAGIITAAADHTLTSGINVTFDNLRGQAVPEPGSLALTGVGLAAGGLWAFCRRWRVAQVRFKAEAVPHGT
jgi:hypothetical protein